MSTHHTHRGAVLGVAVVVVAVAFWASRPDAEAADQTIGSVSFVQGTAQRARGGTATWADLKDKSPVYQGDRLKTAANTRLEATLKDGSKLRLAANSELSLDKVDFSKKKVKTFKAKLVIGSIWASVTKLLGNDSKFEVTTDNAVAGVRGTRFAAAKDTEGKTTVKVYSGQVLVSNQPIYAIKGHTKEKRVEVAGPQEITKDQWQEMVAGAMQLVTIAAGGEMTKPETFAMAEPGQGDDWEAWNSERDKVAGLNE